MIEAPRHGATKLVTELGISSAVDIDIEAIAEFCGATVIYETLRGSSARIVGIGNRAIIIVDAQSHRYRQRFSAAHELGHWMIDRGKLAAFRCSEKDFTIEWSSNNPERRANQFAADLLLPTAIFQPRTKNRDMTFDTVRELGTEFQTSLTATSIRLVELGSFPAMVVCTGTQRRKWYRVGPDVPEAIKLRESPGVYTDLHALLNGKPTAGTPSDTQASDWFTTPRSKHYSIREHSVRVNDGLILTLLWWKDESQLLELEADF